MFSTSSFAFSTISSILDGCILPSSISFSRAILATSLLNGSNPDITTASGVSSIIRSIPVNVSNAFMFLPSLPIILPFISSFGSDTIDTVVSDVWSAAHFCIAYPTISLALFIASSFVLLSMSLITAAFSAVIVFSSSESICFFASSKDKPEILCNSSICLLVISSIF